MVTVYDVPPDKLISNVSSILKENKEIQPPEWSSYVKTGVHKEKGPLQEDWWYTRTSAILRSVYMNGPIGIAHVSAKYGGSQDRGSKPSHAAMGSRSITRKAFQQLEKAGLIDKTPKGRTITSKGQSLLDNAAYEILKEMAKEDPERSKYL